MKMTYFEKLKLSARIAVLLVLTACKPSEIDPNFLSGSSPNSTPVPPFISELDASWAPSWQKIKSVWHFNETSWNGTSGEVRDSSGNGYSGTSNNASTSTSGKFNGSSLFPIGTSNNYIDFTGLTSTVKSYTLSIWLKTTVTAGCRYVLTSNYPALIFASSNCSGHLGYYDGTWHDMGSAVKTDGLWHNYVWVLNSLSGVGIVYEDGVQLGTDTYVGQDLSGVIQFGGYTSSVVEGQIDEVGLWEKALSPQEVLLIYQHQTSQ